MHPAGCTRYIFCNRHFTVVVLLVGRSRPLNLPCISPQNSVTCNGEYRRPVMGAQPSFHDVEMAKRKTYVECFLRLNVQTRTLFAVDPLEKMA